MQFSYASSCSVYQSNLTLATVPAHYRLDTAELGPCLEADDKAYSLRVRRYLRRVLAIPNCKAINPGAHQHSYTTPDEIWVKNHKRMLKEEWKRHKFIATGVIPAASIVDTDIIAMYEST